MWRNVTLRYRLNLLFAVLLLAWLVIDIGRMLAEAGPRARADSESVTRLTSQFVTAALAHVQDLPQPTRDLVGLVEQLAEHPPHARGTRRRRRPFRRLRVRRRDGRKGAGVVSRDRRHAHHCGRYSRRIP